MRAAFHWWRGKKSARLHRRGRQRSDTGSRAASILAILIAVASATVGSGCRSAAAAKPSGASAADPIAVAVVVASEQSMERTAEVQGALYPRERAIVASNVDGNVEQI